jgi:hypothetical protein
MGQWDFGGFSLTLTLKGRKILLKDDLWVWYQNGKAIVF